MKEFDLYVLEDTRADWKKCERWNDEYVKSGIIGKIYPNIKLKNPIYLEEKDPKKYIENAINNNKNINDSIFLLDLAIIGDISAGEWAYTQILRHNVDVSFHTIIMSANIEAFDDQCRASISKDVVKEGIGIGPTITKQTVTRQQPTKWKRKKLDSEKVAPWWELVMREVYECCQEKDLDSELKLGNVNGIWKDWVDMVERFEIGERKIRIPIMHSLKDRKFEENTLNGWINDFNDKCEFIRENKEGNDMTLVTQNREAIDNFLPVIIREIRIADGSWINAEE